MFKLYGYTNKGLELLLVSFNEDKIIEKIGEYIYIVDDVHFVIIKNLEDRQVPYKTIFSEKDYIDYMEEYYLNKEENRGRSLK